MNHHKSTQILIQTITFIQIIIQTITKLTRASFKSSQIYLISHSNHHKSVQILIQTIITLSKSSFKTITDLSKSSFKPSQICPNPHSNYHNVIQVLIQNHHRANKILIQNIINLSKPSFILLQIYPSPLDLLLTLDKYMMAQKSIWHKQSFSRLPRVDAFSKDSASIVSRVLSKGDRVIIQTTFFTYKSLLD